MDIFLTTFTVLLLCFSLLSKIRNDYWTFRVFDYPRLQKFALSIVCLVLLLYFFDSSVLHYILLAALSINLIYLAILIIPFTPLAKKHVIRATGHKPEQCISLMISNVYQENTNYKGCLAEIKKANPDIVLLLETGKHWEQAVSSLENDYHYTVKVPLDNTYGMLLYSKLELLDSEIKYLVENDIPSIHTKVMLRNGKKIQLYALHPTPPVPNENPRSTERDKELLLVADMVKACDMPVVVIGDLNDVAWSYTTELFLKMSGLLDPRRGRGFYNSFNAHYPFMRFPLDHAFISTDFKLRHIRRLNNFNSDHFPIYMSVQYEAKASQQQESMHPDADDIETAREKKAKE